MIPLNILARAYNTPLLLTPEKWAALIGVVSRGSFDLNGMAGLDEVALASAFNPTPRPAMEGGEGIAIITVAGSLVARSSGFSGGSGLRSYASIKRDLQAVLNDDGIGGIMLDLDSHGGEVAGCFALADLIREASSRKPVFAYVNEAAYSAGYALAASAQRIFVSPTSGGGSIGVFMAHTDKSKLFEKEGVAYEYIYSGAKKIDGNPNGPLEKRVRDELQARVDTLRDLFAERIDAFRGLKAGTAKATEAGVFMGQELIETGLADELATFDQALSSLSATINHRQGGKRTMTTKERMAALIESNDDAPQALAELGFFPKDQAQTAEQVDVSALVEAAVEEKVTAVVAEIEGISTLCTMAGLPEMATMLIKDRLLTVEAAKPLILEEKAQRDAVQINSTVGPEVKKTNNFVEFMRQQYPAATR